VAAHPSRRRPGTAEALDMLTMLVPEPLRNELFDRLSHHSAARPAEDLLGRRIEQDDALRRVDRYDRVHRRFDDVADARRDALQRRGVEGDAVEIERAADLFKDETAPIDSFKITDNGIGLDDENFDSFNTAFSRRKVAAGGKGLGRFTWLKAFESAEIESVFRDADGSFLSRSYIFSESYDLDTAGLPKKIDSGVVGTTGHRKIILEFLERAIQLPNGEKPKYPLEEVVHSAGIVPPRTTRTRMIGR